MSVIPAMHRVAESINVGADDNARAVLCKQPIHVDRGAKAVVSNGRR